MSAARSPAPVARPARPARAWLLAAAALSFGVSLLHAVIPLAGPAAYAYFGAAELAAPAARGSPVPALLTFALAALFAAWGAYALSGAGVLRRLPLLRAALLAIGAAYALRGLALPFEAAQLARGAVPARYLAFSLVSLAAGACYLLGAARAWGQLARPRRGAA